jgi:PAS domain S-box-containing protein
MKPRWLSLRLLLFACLAVDAAVLVGWGLLDQLWFTQPFGGREMCLLAGSFVSDVVLTVALFAFVLRPRSAQAENTEAKFRSLLDAAPDPILIMNGEGLVTLVNARAEQLFGHTRDELIGRAMDSLLFHAGAKPELETSLAAPPASSATPPGTETPALQARRKDGTWVPVELNFSPLETKDGVLTISIIRDVTERRKAEQLRSARHAVRRILVEGTRLADAAPELLEALCQTLRLDASILWTVDAAAGVLRYAHGRLPDPVPGSGFPQDETTSATYLAGVGLRGRAWANGKAVWDDQAAGGEDSLCRSAAAAGLREGFAFPVVSGNEVLGVIECFCRNAEERDRAFLDTLSSIGSQVGRFLKYRRAEEAVRESEARKAGILEAAVDAIVTLDREGRILEFNPAAQQIFGHRGAAAVGQEMARLLVPADSRAAYERLLAGCLKPPTSAPAERLEMALARADGSEVPAELTVTRIRTEGAPLFTCYIRDLTDRKKAEEALQRAEENFRQAQKMEAVGRLAGGVAHDFNNILTVITGYTQMLLSALPANSPHRPSVQTIGKSAERAAALTRQLLAFSRRVVLEPRVFDLNHAVADMGKMLQRLIGEHIDLVTMPAADLAAIKADPGQIEQVIMNLAVNACDAMPQGGKLTIETRNLELNEYYARTHPEVKPGRYVMLALSDTGVGMDEATKQRIFEPFFTTKEVGKGTGLGLATVYGIVKQSGGHIAVYSEPGKGSTFKVYLPATDERPTALPGGDVPASRPAPRANGKGTILLVEDEEMVRCLSSEILRQQGYTVREARHGLDALRLSPEELDAVDLTVTDVVMPEMNGRDLAQHLLGRKPNMKVLYVSGYTDNAVIRNGLLEPGSAFLEKPFSPDSLAWKVDELMSA